MLIDDVTVRSSATRSLTDKANYFVFGRSLSFVKVFVPREDISENLTQIAFFGNHEIHF